nr:TadE/TadG family protein [arsenite-oxidising bacterium NT-25]
MKSFTDLLRCRSGNFAITTALLLPVLLGVGGMALDFTGALVTRGSAQAAADSASLAASSALAAEKIGSKAQAERLAERFVAAHLAGDSYLASLPYDVKVRVSESFNAATLAKAFTVDVEVQVQHETSGLSHFLGKSTIDVAVTSTSISSTAVQKSLSMYLVLDKSGSMQASTSRVKSPGACWYYWMPNANEMKQTWRSPCYYNQMETLKMAASDLFDRFDEADPEDRHIRVGSVGYDSKPLPPSPLSWGSDKSREYVSGLSAVGGTSSTEAFRIALKALTDPMEITAHVNKTGKKPDRYILFMTDGANNNKTDDVATERLCREAMDAGITVYAVAFNAPPQAKDLLHACSNAKTYYDATDADKLLEAFKHIGQATAGKLPRLTN